MKIGLFAPSSPCSPERYQTALKQAFDLGHEVLSAQDPSLNYNSKQYLFSSDTSDRRINALELLLSDNSVQVILAARGGYGSFELLPQVAKIKSRLKDRPLGRMLSLAGISDVTALLLALDGVMNLNLIHGPGFIDAFYEYSQNSDRKYSTDSLVDLVQGQWMGYNNLSLSDITAVDGASRTVKGKILGGNLSVVASLVGTSYLPDFTERILFLEEIGEKPYRVHRALTQLKLAGLLSNLKGVLLGSFDQCTHGQGLGPNITDVFQDIFSCMNYPVFMGFPAGHGALNLPLPLGIEVELSRSGVLKV